MTQKKLEEFGGYQKARALFEFVVMDTERITDARCRRLLVQQIDSADSICANIEEGYGRGTRAEFVQFLRFAKGSARETRGRYERFARWLPPELIAERVALCDEVLGILTATMKTLRGMRREGGGKE